MLNLNMVADSTNFTYVINEVCDIMLDNRPIKTSEIAEDIRSKGAKYFTQRIQRIRDGKALRRMEAAFAKY